MNYGVTLSRNFNPCWNALKDDSAIKASIIHHLSVMRGYGCSHEQFVEDFKGRGKITVEDSQIIVQFSDLDVLGINPDSATSPADLDRMFRERITAIAEPKTPADKLIALNKIIGTELNGISTVPNHSQHHRP